MQQTTLQCCHANGILPLRERLNQGEYMRTVTFNAYSCGMSSERTYSEKIMIWAPVGSYRKTFNFNELTTKTVSEFINLIKADANEFLGMYGEENLSVDSVYIQTADILIGFQEDKRLNELFDYFSTDDLQFAYLLVGGASIHCMGYRFVVHPDDAFCGGERPLVR